MESKSQGRQFGEKGLKKINKCGKITGNCLIIKVKYEFFYSKANW